MIHSGPQAAQLVRAVPAILTALLVVTLIGGPHADGDLTEQATPLQAFVKRFQRAFADDDPEAVYDLFHWGRVNAEDRYRISLLITRDLRDRLVATRLEPTVDPASRPRLNLPVVAQLRARFISDDGAAHDSVHQLGIRDGRVYIALPVSASMEDRSI